MKNEWLKIIEVQGHQILVKNDEYQIRFELKDKVNRMVKFDIRADDEERDVLFADTDYLLNVAIATLNNPIFKIENLII